ncbi:E3 ubiquitin-protein ligase TRIM56-like [Watersipora subatra]|uniref:E3 ubiquitin-protein ligase TRIM56-like n=1 Tax=Watersipora subatra TaxID=2589382 RepID=UPI00355BC218
MIVITPDFKRSSSGISSSWKNCFSSYGKPVSSSRRQNRNFFSRAVPGLHNERQIVTKMAEVEEPTSAQCVFCWSKDNRLVDPRVLPCNHVSCKTCLDGQLEAQKVVWCKDCKKFFDVVVDELPTYKLPKAKHECEVCLRKSKNVSAVIYCKTCNKKLCEAHRKWHDELMNQHDTLTIRQYAEQAERLETRYCAEHITESYTLGCDNCLNVFCTSCISLTNACAKGQAHVLLNLPELVNRLTFKIDQLVAAIVSQEEELSTLFKKASKVVSEFEMETKNMLKQLQDRLDAQIPAIKDKYDDVEKKLIESRRKTQEEVTEFMEDKIGTMLTNLSNKRADLEARMKNNHQAAANELQDLIFLDQLPVT